MTGKTEDPTPVDTVGEDTEARPDTGHVSVCDAVAPSAAGAASHSETCSPVEFVDWAVVVEGSADLPGRASGQAVVASPVTDDASCALLAIGTDGVGLVAIDACSLAELETDIPEVTDYPSLVRLPSDGEVWVASQVGEMGMGDQGGAIVVGPIFGEHETSSAVTDFYEGAVSWVDADADGLPEVYSEAGVYTLNAVRTFALQPVHGGGGSDPILSAPDLNQDGFPELLDEAGIHSLIDGTVRLWSGLSEGPMQVAAVRDAGAVRLFGIDGPAAFLARPDGSLVWRSVLSEPHHTAVPTFAATIAIGDATGDGRPDLCTPAEWSTEFRLLDLDGNVLQRWPQPDGYGGGGCAMADLDADGVYEVVVFGPGGLLVADGRTGAVLTSVADFQTYAEDNPPLVLDVDHDGSAEIVVLGNEVGSTSMNGEIRIYGPASERWARTRPIWNQPAYDVTSVRDDGTFVSFPIPSWEAYNSWRAQPAHDGDHPDLVPRLTDACADDCTAGAEGTARIAIQVENLGSKDAEPGASVLLWAHTEVGWGVIASTTLPDPVPSMMAAPGVVLDVPVSQLGDRHAIEVQGVDGDECDRVNDRVEVELGVCGV